MPAKITVPKFTQFLKEVVDVEATARSEKNARLAKAAQKIDEASDSDGSQSTSEQLLRLKDIARLTPSNLDIVLAKYAQPEDGDWRCYLVVTRGSALAAFAGPTLIERANMAKIEKGESVLERIRVTDFSDKSLSRWKIVKTGRDLRTPIEPRPALISKSAVVDAIVSVFGSTGADETKSEATAGGVLSERVKPIVTGLADQENFMHFKFAMAKAPRAEDFEMHLAYRPQQEQGDYRCYFIAGTDERLQMFRGPVKLGRPVIDKISREGFRALSLTDVNEKSLRDKFGIRLVGRHDLRVGAKKPQEKTLPGSFKKEISVVFPAPVEPAAE